MSEISPKIFVCRVDHEHDRIYAENIVEYLDSQSIVSEIIELRDTGLRPELQRCLEEPGAAILGFNAALDHSRLKSDGFLDAAERCGVPVMQWLLDHPSARWPEFGASTASNSCFLLNSRQQQRYFETYCLPGALTAVTGGVGPNRRTRASDVSLKEFVSRPMLCLIPLSLRRIRSVAEHDAARAALDPVLAGVLSDAAASARHDLACSLHSHVAAALRANAEAASPATFDMLCQLVEEVVQTFRRLHIFSVARNFPTLIQSDVSAAPFAKGGAAAFDSDVGMQATLERMTTCRAVLSVTPMNDMIHDRTMNAVNAGCVAIIEDNAANRGIFAHGKNALLFRYDDDSLAECLDIVCNQPERACEIARAGMKLRDDPRLRFGQFTNIVDLAWRGRSGSSWHGMGGSLESRQSRPRGRPVIEAPPKRQAILILGMHRGGTSALAGVINGLGAAVPKNLASPNDANPRGYFESERVFVTLDAMLAAAGSRWDDWRRFDQGWFETDTGQRYRQQIKALLIEEFGDEMLIVLKDPRICRFAPFISSILTELGFAVAALLPVRDFGEVASSLARRDQFTPIKSTLLWLRHVFDAERGSQQMPRCFLSYEGLLADWRKQMARATAAIGVHWPSYTEAAKAKIDEFLEPELRRERTRPNGAEEFQGLTRLARRVQAVLNALVVEGESAEWLDRFHLLRREFDEACDVFGEISEDRTRDEDGLVPAVMPGGRQPELSVVVVVYNMPREAPRTLYSLSAAYQRDIAAEDYEVIVVDNGSDPPFDAGVLRPLVGNFRLIRMESPHPSPARAANRGLAEARGRIVGMLIDGARMATPGLLHFARHGARLHKEAAVTALGWHLGFDLQNWAIEAGYDQGREDALLNSVGWPEDGYRLFEIATPGGSSTDGWFLPVAESNALFLRREAWDALGGLDERFDAPGGGYVNLDLWCRALELPGIRPVVLLGEGTFHQLHGGVATNAAPQSLAGSLEQWEAQYKAIRGHHLSAPTSPAAPTYLGTLPRPALARFVRAALDPTRARLGSGEPPLGSAFDRTLWALAPAPEPRDPFIAALVELTHREFRAGRVEAAAAVARLARRRAPDEPAPQRILAQAGGWLPHGDPPEDRRVEVHLALGEAYRLLGEGEAAEEQYRAALQSSGDDCVGARLGLSRLRMPSPDYKASAIHDERMAFPIGTRMFDRDQPALTREEAEIVRRFHEFYYRHWLGEADTINLSWFGYEVRKCPLDLWIYQELLVRTRPDLVIETGTLFGGSALFMATVMDVIGHGRVISIDRDDRPGRPAHPRISYWLGSSVDDAVVAEAHEAAGHGRTMVVLDSDHSEAHVLQEIRCYSPLVQVGDYLIIEDTNVNGHPAYPGFGPGPMEAVSQFLSTSDEFIVDERCERFLLTMNPKGYLKRVRPIEKMK